MPDTRLTTALTEFVKPLFQRPAHLQVGALCMRGHGRNREVLLVTTITTGRWILPKGWPMPGRSLAEAAQEEAWEEAGVVGEAEPEPVGRFAYDKVRSGGLHLRCTVEVFRIRVKRLAADYPEAGKRRRKWVSPRKAAKMVQEPELRALLKNL